MSVIDQEMGLSRFPSAVPQRVIERIRTRSLKPLLQRPVHWDVTTVMVRSLLDDVNHRLSNPKEDVDDAMIDLLTGLWSIRSDSTPEVWSRVGTQCLNHPIRHKIHEDPFASRCFQKPRGYAGDAVLIDYLYFRDFRGLNGTDRISPLGQRIFDFTAKEIPAGHAVRRRRDLMATIIDEICAKSPRAHILSVACGHLREAVLSTSVTRRGADRFVALDQDEQSVKLVEREVGKLGITPICDSIKALFRSELASEKFDLIYSTGLYDYLDDRVASRLTQRMFEMLNPGGRLLIANFVPDIWCSAYMEALLDWKLIYRSAEQMLALCSGISMSETASCRTFVEENQNIVFLELMRV